MWWARVITASSLVYIADSKHEAWKNHRRLLLFYISLVNIIVTVAGIVGSQRIMAL